MSLEIEMDREILTAFLDESDESLSDVDALFVRLEANPDDRDALDSIFRAFHSIKGNSAFFGLMKIKKLAHQLEDILGLIRDGALPASSEAISNLIKGTDFLKGMLMRVRAGEDEVSDAEASVYDELISTLSEHRRPGEGGPSESWQRLCVDLTKLVENLEGVDIALYASGRRILHALKQMYVGGPSDGRQVGRREVVEPRNQRVTGKQPQPERSTKSNRGASAPDRSASRTMRVEEKRIDEFLGYVGELIIVREMFVNLSKKLRASNGRSSLVREFQWATGAFTSLSHNLQSSIMEVRKVPVKALLTKAPRMARDVAQAREKQVKVQIVGEDLAVDKSLIEMLEAPMTHMVRNAADHGIEPPEQREQNGKPLAGTIDIVFEEHSDEVSLTIADDGGGIDRDSVLQKARAQGLVGTDTELSDADVYQLLFAPGFSTAEVVTDISGRGVGMDVVKRNVTDAGGQIEVSSTPGQGSRFMIRLPKAVSVQIIDGFLLRLGSERFILPLLSVRESFRPQREHVTTVLGKGECIRCRGRIVELVRFAEVLGLQNRAERTRAHTADPTTSISPYREPWEGIVVVVEVGPNGDMVGLAVDDVLGVQQTVVRNLEGLECYPSIFAGGAILGDGRVAMVVDLDRLAKQACNRITHSATSSAAQRTAMI